MRYEPDAGSRIAECAEEMVRLRLRSSEDVTAEFNGIPLTATPTSKASEIVSDYWMESAKQGEAYRRSPEGIAAEARRTEADRVAADAAAEGILNFTKSDAAIWQSWVDANHDPYGAATMRYAARWANYMERELADGVSVEACADKCSHSADKEGITGFMYGAAVSMLAKAWVHGEALRRWHNLKTQIGQEGVRANETGGTLNPALLNIGGQS